MEQRRSSASEMSHVCDYQFNVIVVGDAGVGKSDIVERFSKNTCTATKTPTTIDFKMRKVQIDGKIVKLHLWDVGGLEQHQKTNAQYYQTALGAAIVYDVTNAQSFANVGQWLQRVERQGRSKVVDTSTAKQFADRMGIPFFEVSAKAGVNVEQAFAALAAELKAQHIAAAEKVEHARRLSEQQNPGGVEVKCGCFSMLLGRPPVRYSGVDVR